MPSVELAAGESLCSGATKPSYCCQPKVSDQVSRLAAGWGLLALIALGVSTVFALFLVVARTPFLGVGAEFFRTALVMHVNLAVVVWFLAAAVAIWLAAAAPSCCVLRNGAKVGLWLSIGGVIAMLLALFSRPAPILANYVPLLDSNTFFWGVSTFFGGILLTAVVVLAGFCSARLARPVANALHERIELWQWSAVGAMFSFLVAVVVFMVAQGSISENLSMDDRIWGGGHVLQIVHTLMLMAAWLALGDKALMVLPAARRWIVLLIVIELLASLADLVLSYTFEVGSAAYRQGFTEVMRWVTWPSPFCLAILLVVAYRRHCALVRLQIDDLYLFASMGLFVLGCLVGAGIRGETTSIPAHYHGTVGAVTLAYMVWARRWLLGFGVVIDNVGAWRWQPFVYASGVALLVFGLAWAGWLGVPRKAPHIDAVLQGGAYYLAMGLAGIGGFLAMAGAGIFVVWILRAIVRQRSV